MNPGQVAPKAPGLNPYTRICYICGGQFGTKSIDIHEKACAEKWTSRQATLPKAQRLPLPKRPLEWDAAIGGAHPGQFSAANEAAFHAYMDQSRAECPNCARKFAPDRLEVHLRSCTKDGFFARQSKNKGSGSATTPLPHAAPSSSVKAQPKTLENTIHSLEAVSLSPTKTSSNKDPSSLTALPINKEVPLPIKNVGDPTIKLAKFCTGCGSGFKMEQDKFCGACGIKRVALE